MFPQLHIMNNHLNAKNVHIYFMVNQSPKRNTPSFRSTQLSTKTFKGSPLHWLVVTRSRCLFEGTVLCSGFFFSISSSNSLPSRLDFKENYLIKSTLQKCNNTIFNQTGNVVAKKKDLKRLQGEIPQQETLRCGTSCDGQI